MPSFTDFRSTSKPAVLILGPPGSGKTSLAGMLRNPYILDVDNNIGGALEYYKARGIKPSGSFDVPHLRDGKLVERKDRFKIINELLNKACQDPAIDTLVLDSLSSLIEVVLDEVRRQQGRAIGDISRGTPDAPLQIQDWGLFGGLFRQWLLRLRASGKVLVVIGHVVVASEDLREDVEKLFINLPGKFAGEISGLFTEVWYTSVEERKDDKGKLTYKYYIRTRPDYSMAHLGLKSAAQIEAKVEVNPEQLNKLLFS